MEGKKYRIRLVEADGSYQYDHIQAATAQEAADRIRKERKGCYIVWIAEEVQDWT